jgi:hypothetical protein
MVRQNQPSERPRLGADNKLKSRFYEPLVLLHVLDRYGMERISCCTSEEVAGSQLDLRELRRTFLNQLAYICDRMKGGNTVTAIALEAQPSGVIFWINSNNKISEGTVSFLQTILDTLRKLPSSPSEQQESTIRNEIAEKCIEFNLKRIRAYQANLQGPLRRCLGHLKSSYVSGGEWLINFFKETITNSQHRQVIGRLARKLSWLR